MESENTYISFIENCHRKNSTYIFYIQYNGNEEELAKLHKYLSMLGGWEDGESSDFILDMNTFFSEQTVQDNLLKLKGIFYVVFFKCVGKFVCPITQEINESNYNYEDSEDSEEENSNNKLTLEELYEKIQNLFYFCGMRNMFKK